MSRLPWIVVAAAVAASAPAGETFVSRETAEKASDPDLTFLVTFDRHNAKAYVAKGGGDSFTLRDLDLGLRGLVGFDLRSAYKAEPGESLKYPAKGNFNPHSGTIVVWAAANGYDPSEEKTDGKSRGNVYLAHLVAQAPDGSEIEYHLYEYGTQIYFDWTATPDPWQWGRYGRVHAERKGMRKGEWHQIAASWDDTKLALYFDGEKVDEAALPQKVKNTATLLPGDAPNSYVAIRDEIKGDRHEWDCGVDDVAIYSRPLAPIEIRNRYLALLKNPGSRRVQAFDVTLNGVVTGPRDPLDRLEAEFDFSPLPDALAKRLESEGLEVRYSLVAPDGTSRSGSHRFTKRREAIVFDRVDRSGAWKFVATLGAETVSAEAFRPEMPWLGNSLGDEDEVPALWRDFAVNGRSVKLWNRQYEFGAGPLPTRIVAFGKDLLARRPRLLVDGAEPEWKAGETSRTARDVTYTGTGRAGGVGVTYRTVVSFDGMVDFSWTLAGGAKVESMSLDWKVAKENSRWLMTPRLWEGDEDPVRFRFPGRGSQAKMLWLVTERKGGFAFTVPNDANWVYDEEKPVFAVDRRSGACAVRVITKPVASMPEGCDYRALFIATPTRPLPERNRAIRYTGPGGISLVHADGRGLFNSSFTHAPQEGPAFDRRYAKRRDNSMSVYGGVKSLTSSEPETDYLLKYWERPGAYTYTMTLMKEDAKGETTTVRNLSRSACASTVYSDYAVWCDWKLWTHPLGGKFWQSYFDLCGVSLCRNPHHGCLFRDRFGREIATFDVLHTRKLVQRLVALAHRYGKTVILHGQRDYLPFVQGMADYWFPGEQYSALMNRNLYGYTDEVPDAICRTEFNRDVLGIGVIHLPAIGHALRGYGREENWKYTWGMLAKLVAHDVETGELYAAGKPVRKVWDIYDAYGCDNPETRCHPYYEQREVKCSDPTLRTTWYSCPSSRVLVAVSNYDAVPHDAEIDVSALGVSGAVAYDEIGEREMAVSRGRFRIDVPARAFAMVGFPRAARKDARAMRDVVPQGVRAEDCKTVADAFDAYDTKSWSHWSPKTSKASYGHRSDAGRKAPGALSLKIVAQRPPENGSGCFLRNFQVKPGAEYTAIAWVKAEGLDPDAKVSMGFQGKDEKFIFLGTPVISTDFQVKECRDWKRLLLSFTVPKEGRWARCANLMVTIGVGGRIAGELLVDDFSFTASGE